MPEYPFADDLEKACRHCATIARAKVENWWKQNLVPELEDPTATVTFIAIKGRTYAVTAWHVIDFFREAAVNDGVYPEGYFLPARPGFFMPPPWTAPLPDIGLCPIDPGLPARIGKHAFELEPKPVPTFPVAYALAVGFPTMSKTLHPEPEGNRVALQCVHAIAEGVGSVAESDQIQFLSAIEKKPFTASLSGLSGGPAFWSDGAVFGLLGFGKQAMDLEPKEGEDTLYSEPRVHFLCQRASYETFAEWAAYADATFPRERDALNRKIQG